MALILMGIIGLLIGLSWIKDAKKEKKQDEELLFFVYGFKGLVLIGSSIIAILAGIIKLRGI